VPLQERVRVAHRVKLLEILPLLVRVAIVGAGKAVVTAAVAGTAEAAKEAAKAVVTAVVVPETTTKIAVDETVADAVDVPAVVVVPFSERRLTRSRHTISSLTINTLRFSVVL